MPSLREVPHKLNLLARFADDGKNRGHVPPLQPLTAGFRAAQFVLALVILILAAVSASEVRGELDAHGMAFFVFVWTMLYLGYILGSSTQFPEFYNIYAHVAAEILTNFWWLVAWAMAASRASAFPSRYYFPTLFSDTLKAMAGLGALEWLLFCVTSFFLVTQSKQRIRELGTIMARTGGLPDDKSVASPPLTVPPVAHCAAAAPAPVPAATPPPPAAAAAATHPPADGLAEAPASASPSASIPTTTSPPPR